MRSYKEITTQEAFQIIYRTYANQHDIPFATPDVVPNNWLKLHGYAKRRGKDRRYRNLCLWKPRK